MSFNRSFNAHPIQVFYYLKPTLFVLLIPLFRTFFDAILEREVSSLFINEIILATLIILYSIIKWRRFNILIVNDKIIIKKGAFFFTTTEIKKENISSVQTVRSLPDRLFRCATLKINTESGRKGKADFEIKLGRSDAESICDLLFPRKNQTTIRFSAVRVAIMAAAASSAFTGLIFIVPFIRQSGVLLGTALEELLLERINEISAATSKMIPPAINTVTIIFLILYITAFFMSFLKYINFSIRISNGTMSVTSGLLRRFDIVFRIKSVNSVIIEQTPLMRLLNRYLVRVSVGGYGDNKGYKSVIIPSARESEIERVFGGLFQNNSPKTVDKALGVMIKPQKMSRRRFYVIPTLFLGASVVAYVVLIRLFPVFKEILSFVLLVLLSVGLYYFTIANHNYENSAINISNTVCARYSRWASICEAYCKAQRVGLVHITMWPNDRRHKTCNIRFTERSEGAEKISVKHISYVEIKNQLSDFYNFNSNKSE